MDNQNIILTIVIAVFVYVAWSINHSMSNNLELISKQVAITQSKDVVPNAVNKEEPKVQSVNRVKNNTIEKNNLQNSSDIYRNEMSTTIENDTVHDSVHNVTHDNAYDNKTMRYEEQSHTNPHNPHDPHEHNPFELYMGKQQYLDDRPHRAPLPNLPQRNPSGNGKGNPLFDREIQHINNIPGGIMANSNGINELEPEGVLTSLAGEYDGTMADGVVAADNILKNQSDDSNQIRATNNDNININIKCNCSSCRVPGKTSEQCVNKMMQQTGSYNQALRSCNLPGSTSERCHSSRFVG